MSYKKIILSKVIAILRPDDDSITFSRKTIFFKNITIGNTFFSYIILLNCFHVCFNLLCEEKLISGMWYADDSFIILFLNMLFFILA